MTQVKKISAIILISLISLIIPQGLHAQTPIPESAPPAKEAAPPKVKTSNVTPNPPEKSLTNPTQIQPEAIQSAKKVNTEPAQKAESPSYTFNYSFHEAPKEEAPAIGTKAWFLWFIEKYLSPIMSFFALVVSIFTFIALFWQTCLTAKTTKLQANTTQLSQVKLQLETILRGSAVPLGQQALSVGYSDHADMIQKRKDFIITQICGEDATEEKKAWVTTLVNQWFELEKKLSA